MNTYTVILLRDPATTDGRPHTFMTSVEATDPNHAAKLAAMECENDSAMVVAVMEGEHDDVYEHWR